MNKKITQISWYNLSSQDVQTQLHANIKSGLTSTQVESFRNIFGKNTFETNKKNTAWTKIYAQIKNPLVLILMLAGLTTLMLGEYLDMSVIFIALLINIIVGYFQEKRAESAFDKLVESQEKFATVIRDDTKHLILADELVPGDTVIVEAGMYVPADIRMVSSKNLMLNESALTGEWIDVPKDPAQIDGGMPITKQYNMAWMGTFVTAGSGVGVVISTGDSTQIGIVAKELSSNDEEIIPLQRNIQRLAKYLTYVVIAAIFILLLVGVAKGYEIFDMILIAVAIAVAVMPGGLPAAVTVVLAVGMEAILKKGGLVRDLLAAETLGNTTIILTDKTGTLTKAQMHISDIISYRSLVDHDSSQKTTLKNAYVKYNKNDLLKMAIFVADAFVENKEDSSSNLIVHGRPVERAVIGAGVENGISQVELFESEPRQDYLAFESERRYAASLHRLGTTKSKKRRVYITGSPELLLEKAVATYKDGKKIRMTKAVRNAFMDIQKKESANGMRLVAVGYHDVKWNSFEDEEINKQDDESILEGLIFGGFLVLHDPIRSDIQEAIKIAKQAGATVIMLTGDNPITAGRIAKEAGITQNIETGITGVELENMDDDTLLVALRTSKVFARVLPKQKLRICRLLKSQNEVVAMTGDGINDAPALRNADIGIALGSGTEVAKEASDLILLNDSFSIIVSAIEEGRRIRDNLKKIVTFLVSTSFSVLFIVGGSIIIGAPLPILPAQILWINIIEEGFMSFAFAFEPAEKNVMKRNPKSVAMKQILTKNLKKLITVVAAITGTFLTSIYLYLYYIDGMNIDHLRTFMFVALSMSSLFFTFSIKDLHRPVWRINLFSNKYLLFAFMTSFAALVLALEFEPLRNLLQLTDISFKGYFIFLIIGIINLFTIEIAKYAIFRKTV